MSKKIVCAGLAASFAAAALVGYPYFQYETARTSLRTSSHYFLSHPTPDSIRARDNAIDCAAAEIVRYGIVNSLKDERDENPFEHALLAVMICNHGDLDEAVATPPSSAVSSSAGSASPRPPGE